jgi:rhamnosyltransferase
MNIFSIIVCFNPEILKLQRLCNILTNINSKIVLVDNSNNQWLNDFMYSTNIHLIKNNDNIGIAAAQNIGIKYALDNSADIFVFFDQDSEIENDFIDKLIKPLNIEIPMVVSPIFHDYKEGFQFPSYKLNRFGLLKKLNIIDNNIFNVDVIISSGSATNRITLYKVGLMNEDYFIDFVDTEWSLRCKSKGVPVKVIQSASMIHTIGEKSIDLKLFRLFVHSPTRSYYKIRNSFLFARSPYVPFLLGLSELISALIHNFLIIFFVKKKWKYFKNYYQAIFDGLKGKIGKK